MAQPLPYPMHYMPQTQYYISPHPQHVHVPGQMHMVNPAARTEQPQRKRPKYTRSKTGCLTCRAKKIKCDETKPSCQRCTHGQRECTWPEAVPTKKKPAPRKAPAEETERPSTADSSSRVSESSSTSPETTPFPRDLSAGSISANVADRRYSEPQLQPYGYASESTQRRQLLPDLTQGSQPSRRMMSSVPEMSSYSPQVSSSYRLDPTESAVSSRSNSRPSTANSLPPSRYPNIMQPVDMRGSWSQQDEYGQSYGVRYQTQ